MATVPGSIVLLLGTTAMILCAMTGTRGLTLGDTAVVEGKSKYPNYEYQREMPKRAALLLDRLLVALQKAVDNDEMEKEESKPYVRSVPKYLDLAGSEPMPLTDEKTMDLQRRGQAKGHVYWRCYFNAVTCFKRK